MTSARTTTQHYFSRKNVTQSGSISSVTTPKKFSSRYWEKTAQKNSFKKVSSLWRRGQEVKDVRLQTTSFQYVPIATATPAILPSKEAASVYRASASILIDARNFRNAGEQAPLLLEHWTVAKC